MGTDRLTWRDLLVILTQQPAGSAYARAVVPSPEFGLVERLMLMLEHRLRVLIWQNTGDPNARRPEMIQVPGDAEPERAAESGDMRWAPEPMTIEEMNARLGWAPSDN